MKHPEYFVEMNYHLWNERILKLKGTNYRKYYFSDKE